MAESPGSLIDKLCVVNNKLWHAQEEVGGAALSQTGLDADTVKKLYHLNLERSLLINEYNEMVGWKGPPIVKIT